jgi:hypothetical protein
MLKIHVASSLEAKLRIIPLSEKKQNTGYQPEIRSEQFS